MPEVRIEETDTPHGPARYRLHCPAGPHGLLVLGHGAGGGIDAPDLTASTEAGLELGMAVALVEQPYRVAGRRAPAPAGRLDTAWMTVLARLTELGVPGPLITGGRSSGARVACRTAALTGAAGVLCLAFPLHPPGRPERSRLPELEAVRVPVLIVQGERDPFGRPPAAAGRQIVTVPGTHSLRSSRTVYGAVLPWLRGVNQG